MSTNTKRKVSELLKHKYSVAKFSKKYSEPSRTTKSEHFVEIVKIWAVN